MSSIVPPQGDVLGSLLLRSSTPAIDEKVLMYLEGLRPGMDDSDTVQTPRTKASSVARSQASSWRQRGYANGEDEDELASNVQEGKQSTLGSMVRRNGVPRQPGPDDQPGPHYASFGSSFGNFGPLPPDSAYGGAGASTTGRAAGAPLPTSAGAPSTKVRSSRAGSRASAIQKPQSVASRTHMSDRDDDPAVTAAEFLMSPKMGSQATSQAPNGVGDGRVPSPRSHASHAQSKRSSATQQARGSEKASTVYPPLPQSQSSNFEGSQARAMSHRRSHSRTTSLSPSDSATNIHVRKAKSKQPTLQPVESVEGSQLEESPKPARSRTNGDVRSQTGASAMSGGQNGASQRPFSPYRNGPTNQDLLHAAIRGRSVASEANRSRTNGSTTKRSQLDPQSTPTPSRPQSPENELDEDEQQVIAGILTRATSRTPRTSYAATSVIDPENISHFHDMDLCILLHQLDDSAQHEIVKKAVRKAVKTRVKKLGMKYDPDTLKQYRKSFHDHDPSVHLDPNYGSTLGEEPPEWAKELLQTTAVLLQRIERIGPKIDSLRSSQEGSSLDGNKYRPRYTASEMDRYGQTPMTQTVNIQTQPTGTIADESMFQPDTDMHIVESTHGHTLPGSMHRHDGSTHLIDDEGYEDDDQTHMGRNGYGLGPTTEGDNTRLHALSEYANDRNDSPGQQYLEEELYKLRARPNGSQSAVSHKTWELMRDDGDEYIDDPDARAVTESGIPEIPDSNPGGYGDHRAQSPMSRNPADRGRDSGWAGDDLPLPPAWQRIHQRLLNWAIVWPLSELDSALNSTTRGNQVDEVALSIWSTQTYKRYVRSKMTDSPPGRVDRLFVPPNMADAISNAVFNGRHGDASGMLRELWYPFGLDGMPRLLIVLARHRSDANHWVVHRFSLPDGTLTTYDSYPERCLPDGRPLGWWFAIRIAWPNAIYPSPDHLMQKMVRLHRPMQLGIDNSVAAAGIWRNLLMGSRAERSLDLERLRDLINTEVKNLRQRKQMGKLSIGAPRPNWEDMN